METRRERGRKVERNLMKTERTSRAERDIEIGRVRREGKGEVLMDDTDQIILLNCVQT